MKGCTRKLEAVTGCLSSSTLSLTVGPVGQWGLKMSRELAGAVRGAPRRVFAAAGVGMHTGGVPGEMGRVRPPIPLF